MDAVFWHERWISQQTPFHEKDGNALFTRNAEALDLTSAARVFLPLCGKTRDIAWLLARGFRVVGAELSRLAIDQLFEDLGVAPSVLQVGGLIHYAAEGIDIFVGDIFDVDTATLGPVDLVYDRAALVALPEEIRPRYAAHVTAITHAAPQMLICFEYDQDKMDGPPFSVTGDEVRRHYTSAYTISEVERIAVDGRLKGIVDAEETLWRLRPR